MDREVTHGPSRQLCMAQGGRDGPAVLTVAAQQELPAFPYLTAAQKGKSSGSFRTLNKTLHVTTWPVFSSHLKPKEVDF